jgi:hypothetical protein
MKVFVALALYAVTVTAYESCDIDCMTECWDNYTTQEASFKEYDCLKIQCRCSDYVSDSMTGLVEKI